MRAIWVAGVLVFASIGRAQTTAEATAHAPDGAVRQTLQSILIPPLINAPFSATVETEWTKIMPDGSTATVKNHRTVARDTSGRIFEERRYLTPKGDQETTPLSALDYLDPNRHERYQCIPAEKTCYASAYTRPAMATMPAGMSGLAACGCGSARRPGMSVEQEAIGQNRIEEVDVTGSREITTIATGQIGNEKPEPIVKEFWYSPRLGVNLVTKRFDPRSGIANFLVTHISLSEPDLKMFEPPAEYRVVRQVVERPGIAQGGQ